MILLLFVAIYYLTGSQAVAVYVITFNCLFLYNPYLFSFVCSSAKLWNSLPYNVVHASSVRSFISRLKHYLGL